MNYFVAWLVALGAGLIGAVGLFFLTRSIETQWSRDLLRWLPPVLLLVPAPVPDFAGHYAPAFIVLVFEGLFQADGQSLLALVILLVAALIVAALSILRSRPRILD